MDAPVFVAAVAVLRLRRGNEPWHPPCDPHALAVALEFDLGKPGSSSSNRASSRIRSGSIVGVLLISEGIFSASCATSQLLLPSMAASPPIAST